MNQCKKCGIKTGSLACPCGKYAYCSVDCSTSDDHLTECQPNKLDFGYHVSVLYNLLPIMEALKSDQELYDCCKNLADKIVSRLK
jgi:hypothetical protein